jgi:hypothetical protein
MRLVLATHTLQQLGGGSTYLLTLATQLLRTGHAVVVYGVDCGRMAEILRESGLAVVERPADLPEVVDALVTQDHDVALELRDRYPGVPNAFVLHSNSLDINAPPQATGAVDAVVVLHDRMRRHAAAFGDDARVVRLRQPVDLLLYAPRAALRPRPRRLLLLGNNMRSQRRAMVEDVCRDVGVECRIVGLHAEPTEHPELEMNDADVVMGRGRVIVEAMACGRAAYVFDESGGDGWVTAESYAAIEAENFAGHGTAGVVDARRLREDLAAYDPEMGVVNRDLAQRHNAIDHADAVVALLKELSPAPAPSRTALDELVRMVRVAWSHETRAHRHAFEVEQVRERLADAERRLSEAGDVAAEAAAAGAARDDARRWLDEAEERLRLARELEASATAFRGTSRYRLANALARPLDWTRARAREPSE